ncbi:aminodeoxychorismate synthase component I [Tabrizicola oligotrophica]|uniref:Aminodeoxychorismate synthase component I n=1 Tax=Tabrizicola oligotrophica TaxID=2710650 RepID=A0A6M0QSC8_9RHOB|nr:aminodeoxychorismate synthase component I [Tabrizicola oligotrophica]NEY90390.1 aminodeoxychorismate synthase component I [Tabrizicola oligotrophica]
MEKRAPSGLEQVLVEDGPAGLPALFDAAAEVLIARTGAEMPGLLAALDRARADGFWVAGYISYEAGYALEPKLAALEPSGGGPRAVFGVFPAPKPAGPLVDRAASEAAGVALALVEPMVSRAEYDAAMARVMGYIGAGDCYQINLTFPMRTTLLQGSALGLYGALRARQAVGRGAFVDLGVGPVLVSRSPELFIAVTSEGRIEARPMKGTAPRDADPVVDAELAEELRASEKGQAENLMIVDLLRNDISRVAKVGSVKVPKLFAVETYATVHQMVSTVVGDLVQPPSMAGVMEALFPCGSITGAPKIRAMEIIHEVEPFARGAYCGAIGWMAPDGAARFNVAIRTLSVTGRDIVLNVGGGVVQDSTASGEWEEALWKARYVQGLVSRG